MALATARSANGLGDPAKSGLLTRVGKIGSFAVRHRFSVGRNPSIDIDPDNPSKWAALDFYVETGRGGGNRVHARAINLVGIDPPEVVLRGAAPNNTAPFGPNQDGTDLEGMPLGRGLGRITFQGLQAPGITYQGWAGHIGCFAAENFRQDSLVVTTASEITLGPATPGTIEIVGDMDAITASDGVVLSFRDSGVVRIGGTRVDYAARDANTLFGCTGGGVKTAQVFLDPAGDNNRLKFTAKTSGAAGNNVSITCVDPGTPAAALSVGVVGNAITVNLATDASSNLSSTATEIQAAVRASAAAAALVNVNNKFIGSDGSGVVPAVAQTSLTGGADSTVIAAGTSVQQIQTANAGVLHFHTSALGTNSRSDRLRINPEGSVAIGEEAINRGLTNFFSVQGGQSRFLTVTQPSAFDYEIVGTPGTTTITYKLIGNTPHAGQTNPVSLTITDAPNTLSDTNYVRLSWNSSPGIVSWDVIRESTDGLPADTGPIVYRQRHEKLGSFGGLATDRGQAPAGVNTVQTVVVRNADGGTFRLAHGGGETNAINWDASAADMESKLEALGAIGAGNVTVTKTQNFPPSWQITFDGALAGTSVEKLTIRPPLELTNTAEEPVEEDTDPQDIPEPSVEIRLRVKGGPVAYVLPTYNSTADVRFDGAIDHDGSRLGFYGTAPIAKQTGVAVTAGGIHTALVNLGLIAA